MSPLRRHESGQRVEGSSVGRDLIQVSGDYVPGRSSGHFDYRNTVRQLTAARLRDREAELAELARFCTAEDGPGYAWWRAGAWAGKSALMASFVLDPPDGVRIVSFFVTARYAAHNDRTAFLDIVLAQLSAVVGEDLPYLTSAMRVAHLATLYERAAEACRAEGKRLVLVVDGLDEDRSRIGGGEHSIAGLLPRRLPAGLRVIVASRPNPPLPPDVPKNHPLRDPRIVRLLDRSPHAEADRFVCEQDLKILLADRGPGTALLGLIAAAGGGLTTGDLAELAGVPVDAIHGHLKSIAGRTFRTQVGRWDPSREVLVLAHDDLRTEAAGLLGPALESYRERIHEWADRHRDAGWPPHTPEYLLLGYFRMLVDSGDVRRIAECATDGRRHERMLARSGGDSAALSEIADAQALLLRQEPDLAAMARLAMRRAALAERNANLPPHLPAVWARLGNGTRARALAGAMLPAGGRDQALADVADALAERGDHNGATSAARRIEADPRRLHALARIARARLAAGDIARARAAALALDPGEPVVLAVLAEINPGRAPARLAAAIQAIEALPADPGRDLALAFTATTAARIGDLTSLDVLAELLRDTFAAADPELHTALVDGGHLDLAERIAESAEESLRTEALATLAGILLDRADRAPGNTGRARALAESAAMAATTGPRYELPASPQDFALAPERAAEILARVGAEGWVATLARNHPGDEGLLAGFARGYAAAGKLALAEECAGRIRSWTRVYGLTPILRRATDPALRERIAVAAEEAAWEAPDPLPRSHALATVAAAAAAAGDPVLAEGLALDVEDVARSITDPALLARKLSALGRAIGPADPLMSELADEADVLVAILTGRPGRREAAAASAGLRMALGDPGPFDELVEQLTGRYLPEAELLADAAVARGDLDRLARLAGTVPDGWSRAVALTAAVAGSDPETAAGLLPIAVLAADELGASEHLAALGPAYAAAGDLSRGEALARRHGIPALAEVARIAAERGDRATAHRILAECETAGPGHNGETGESAAAEVALGLAWLAAGDAPAPPSGPGARARARRTGSPLPARDRAARYAAQALARGDVLGPWRLVGALDPAVPRAIAAELIREAHDRAGGAEGRGTSAPPAG
jgi:tetratricopeptide (TPR) repeat protein